MASIFCALIEIQPLAGCELDPSQTAGAAVRCYIPAANPRDAISLLEATLIQMKFKLIETEWCLDHDATDWENPACKESDELVSEARSTGTVVFGTFHTWSHDALDD